MGSGITDYILFATSDPLVALFIGLLVTAILQSSSTSTALIVAMVASEAISFTNAVPMVMGANIGTTITSTIVSLGYINNKKRFKKAISIGTVHDFFNILAVIIIFPLEYFLGVLSGSTKFVLDLFDIENGQTISEAPVQLSLYAEAKQILISFLNYPAITIILALALLFIALKIISNTLSKRVMGQKKEKLKNYVFDKPLKSFGWGALVTASVQSSSLTTSLMVPFGVNGKIALKKVTPFIFGANVGTTITALMAATFRSEAAVNIALVHLFFNLFGILIFLPWKTMRRIPESLAKSLGNLTRKFRLAGLLYIFLVFFLIPFTLIFLNRQSVIKGQLSQTAKETILPAD